MTVAKQNRQAGEAGITAENYAFLQQEVYRQSGVVLEASKQYLIEARLGPILHQQGLTSVNDLCALLRAVGNDGLRRQVVEAVTINETFFFREPAQYEALRNVVLPELIARRRTARALNCLSAGTSSGQEAYSLAMVVKEMGLAQSDVRIVATDLAESMLERARAGRYSQLEVNRGLPAAYLVKYFTRHGLEWQLRDELRRMVQFERHDLRQSLNHLGPFDLVFCRNVLIYFDAETRQRILRQIRKVMYAGGYLLLGAVETVMDLEELFERKRTGEATFYQAR